MPYLQTERIPIKIKKKQTILPDLVKMRENYQAALVAETIGNFGNEQKQ